MKDFIQKIGLKTPNNQNISNTNNNSSMNQTFELEGQPVKQLV